MGRRVDRGMVLGITGPIGCGKSTIAGWLAGLGASVIDADAVAHHVTGPGTEALTAIVDRFGVRLLRPDGSLDRPALGRLVFSDPAALADLEEIVHPAVRSWIHQALTANADNEVAVTVIEAIRLAEGGLADWCDEIWLVTCDPKVQRRRLLGRGTKPADADQRMAAQGNLAERAATRATRIIDTSDDEAVTRERVMAAWSELGLD
jgi:dephospho-CoA kinase